MHSFFVTIPHSGEQIAAETPWLKGLPEPILMRDLDRFVDKLYMVGINSLSIPFISTPWHRYVVDLNRFPEDIDAASVVGAKNEKGTHPKGFHWSVTTHNEPLIETPMDLSTHELIREKYYEPFHKEVEALFEHELAKGSQAVYQLDAHSMPSRGQKGFHLDAGEERAEIVLGDCHGTSCSEAFRAIVEEAYKKAGFQVVMNWPYKGGRITERYGRPKDQRHTIQVEMNRAIYMNEETKQIDAEKAEVVSKQVEAALKHITNELQHLHSQTEGSR